MASAKTTVAGTTVANATAERAQMGDQARDVIGAWFDEHVDTIHRYVARRLGDDLANDVTADTFRTALEQFDRFDPGRGQPVAWLYGIATNLIRRHARTEQRRLRNQLLAVDPSGVGLDPLIDVDRRIDADRDAARAVAAVERLDPADRDLIVLAAWEGMSSAQIAEVLDMPASTVRAHLRRIRGLLASSASQTNQRAGHTDAATEGRRDNGTSFHSAPNHSEGIS